jgi:hypothetical protein
MKRASWTSRIILSPAGEALKARERKLGLISESVSALAWSEHADGSAEFLNRLYPGLRFAFFNSPDETHRLLVPFVMNVSS